jgi:hypothetical protein
MELQFCWTEEGFFGAPDRTDLGMPRSVIGVASLVT